MLKRVALSDVQLGMFIHKMEGSWLKHPFWKSRFMVADNDSLFQLRESDLESVIIDTEKGKDVIVTPVATSTVTESTVRTKAGTGRRTSPLVAAIKTRQSVDLSSTIPTNTAQEAATARMIADKAEKRLTKVFLDARLSKAVSIRKVEPMVQDIYASVQRNPYAFSGLMRCKLNNEFVYRHALSVSALMVSLARKMNLSADMVREAGLAGLFLDIGTNYLPKEAAAENGDFSDADPEIWHKHVMFGEKSLRDAVSIPENVVLACIQHHERMNGSGFPNQLKGSQISLLGQIAGICDTFDYLLIDTQNRRALDPADAIVALREMGDAFDPEVLRNFIESVGIYPIGSFVKLRSDRLAMVIDEDREAADKPIVMTFYSLTSNQRISPSKIELSRCYGQDEIVGMAVLDDLVLPETNILRELLFLQGHKIKS